MNSQTDLVVVDGEAALLMRALRNHTSLVFDKLKELVRRELESDDRFVPVLDYVIKKDWVVLTEGSLGLTDLGALWLDQQSNELAIEQEDSHSDGTPKHPYDAAKLHMETKHTSVFQVLRKIEKKEINLNPDFQRAFVWNEEKQSRLIESILIRIPLPAFYIDATSSTCWNVVDGLQRLTTLNRYCREQTFSLSNLQFLTELEGKKFDALPAEYKVLIEDETELLFYNLMPGTPILAKYTIFSRVNTGGMQLTPQEIRHALSQGKSTLLLQRLAINDAFRQATDGVVESLRMSDRELVLRALAFIYFPIEKYKEFNELDRFLLYTMNTFNELSDAELNNMESEFIASLKKVRAIFGRYAFRKFTAKNGRRSPLNKALFEVWVVSVRSYTEEALVANKEKITDEFIKLLNPWDNFSRSISSSTSSYWAISTRFSAIQKLLSENCK